MKRRPLYFLLIFIFLFAIAVGAYLLYVKYRPKSSSNQQINQNITTLSVSKLNLQGSTPQIGRQGDRGSAGPQGPAGANGSDGSAGKNGAAGSKGAAGAKGSSGTPGATGLQGVTGPQGPAGPSGNGCMGGVCVSLQSSSPGTPETGNLNISGSVMAGVGEYQSSLIQPLVDGSVLAVQDSIGQSVMNVDTSLESLVLGQPSTLSGSLILWDASSTEGVQLTTSSLSGSYSLLLPDLGPGTFTICTDSGNCGGGGGTLQNAYDNSGSPATIQLTIGKDLQILSDGGDSLLNIDSNANQIALGQANALDGVLVFNSAASSNNVTFGPGTLSGSYNLNLPDLAVGTYDVCTSSGNCGTGDPHINFDDPNGSAYLGYGITSTGFSNTVVGYQALTINTGTGNTAIGRTALQNNTIGNFNVAIGPSSLNSNIDGSSNVAIGSASLATNTSGFYNIGIGGSSLQNNTIGVNNISFGNLSLVNNDTGNYNLAVGTSSLQANVSGDNNTSLGYQSGYSNLGSGNVFLGYQSGYNETGSDKLYIANSNTTTPLIGGDFAASALTVNGSAVFINPVDSTTAFQVKNSSNALVLNVDTTNGKVFIQGNNDANPTLTINSSDGTPALEFRPGGNGYSSTYIGFQAGAAANAVASNNTAIGFQALQANTGTDNTAVGTYALIANDTGVDNTALGYAVLESNTGGIFNTAVGSLALRNNTTGLNNNAYGVQALTANDTGNDNNAFGQGALGLNLSGSDNIAIGNGALASNTTGNNNTAVGSGALIHAVASDNVAVGLTALYQNTSGTQNTAIGTQSGYSNFTGSGNIFVGYQAGLNETGSNKLYISNSSTSTPLIHGDFGLSELTFNGNTTIANNESLTANGSVLFKNATDSTTAFQIQNSSAVQLFSVDSTNSRIYVGNATPDSVGTILVLDTKNTSGDPTGVSGGMYYNSSSGKFRCYENGDWRDCSGGTLGYAAVTANQGSVTTEADLTSLSSAVTIPANHRIRITAQTALESSVAADRLTLRIKESGTVLQTCRKVVGAANLDESLICTIELTPSSGSHTYKLSLERTNGTGNGQLTAGATQPASILVEDIGQ